MHAGDHGLAGGAQAVHSGADFVGGDDFSAGGVHVEDDGGDLGVLHCGPQFPADALCGGAGFLGEESGGAGGEADGSVDGDDGDLSVCGAGSQSGEVRLGVVIDGEGVFVGRLDGEVCA